MNLLFPWQQPMSDDEDVTDDRIIQITVFCIIFLQKYQSSIVHDSIGYLKIQNDKTSFKFLLQKY
jgi:hypothetical protein